MKSHSQECKGLPLAIIVVAAPMSLHTYLHEWKLASNQMSSMNTFYDMPDGLDEKLFQHLKWSYNVLPFF